MRVRVNGSDAELDSGTTAADIVQRYGADASGRGVAVAINGEVIARGMWDNIELGEGDRVEVLGAIGGG